MSWIWLASGGIKKVWIKYLDDPGEARSCSINIVVITLQTNKSWHILEFDFLGNKQFQTIYFWGKLVCADTSWKPNETTMFTSLITKSLTKKSRLQETLNILVRADSSTNKISFFKVLFMFLHFQPFKFFYRAKTKIKIKNKIFVDMFDIFPFF